MESWSNLCRCCLSPNSEVSLLNNEHNVKEKFLQITTIEVKVDDGLPQKLCEECFSIMNSAYQFRTQCMKMDKELRLQIDAIVKEPKEDMLSQFSQIETQVKATEDMTVEDIAKESMKQLESIIKIEPNDDEDYYYVLVIDNPKDKEPNEVEEKDITIKKENYVFDKHDKLIKQEIDVGDNTSKVKNNEQTVLSNEESAFENCIESFLVTNPKVPINVPATILENEEVQDGDSQFDHMEIVNPMQQDQQLEEIDKENVTIIDKETLAVYEGQKTSIEGLKVFNDDVIKNLPNKNVIKILTPTGEERTIVLKGSGDVNYTTDTSDENKDLSQPEIIYCEGDEASQFQFLKCDGQNIVIEYTDDSQIATVLQQEDGSLLCECGKEFKDFTEYEKHQYDHNPAGEHFCNLCGKGFESAEILTGHMLLHTVTGQTVTCPYCNQIIKRNNLTQHIKYVHNDKPKCSVCSKSFANSNNLKRHMMIHKGIRDFECDICHKRFGQKITMQTHRLTHINSFHTCNLCGIKFEDKAAITEHREKDECTRSKVAKVKEELMKTVKQEITTNFGKILGYACSLCKKMFSVESALESHIENKHIVEAIDEEADKATNKKPMKRFECEICGKGCASQAMLIMHERVHTNERPFPCQLCSLRFKTKTHLRTHQLTHTREKKFGCSVCMKFFALKGNLVVHLRTHTGERPYICSICNEAFIDSKYLKKHKLKRHSIQNVPWNQY